MQSFRAFDARSAEGRADWLEQWRRWPGREVSAHPEYALLFARPCDRVVCAASEDERGGVLFPLLLRPLAAEPWARPHEERWDAITPYGYGGPHAWGERESGDRPFWDAFEAWCRAERVVCTFARLSLFREHVAPLPWPVEVRARNVVIPLAEGPEALWRGYSTRVRRWVEVARRAGVTVEVDREGARLDAFTEIYAHTMERNHADRWYFFPREFFEAIAARLRGHYTFFHGIAGGRVVSSDLALCSEECVYYFLGGTRAESFDLGPNYLVKHEMASWAIAQGKKACVLGGSHAENDGLLRYKQGYARRGVVPFSVTWHVHDERGYQELVRDRSALGASAGQAWTPREGFFPAYRS